MSRSRTGRGAQKTRASFARLSSALDRYRDKLIQGVTRAQTVAMFEVKVDVDASRPGKGIPRDKGVLAASGRVIVRRKGKRPQVGLAYGGPEAPYALYQHERLDLQHALGEARYLIRAMERWKFGESAALKALQEQHRQAATLSRGLAPA